MPLTVYHNSYSILVFHNIVCVLLADSTHKALYTNKGCCLQMPSLLEDPRLVYSSPASDEVSPFDFSKEAKYM